MNKADAIFRQTLKKISVSGEWDVDPRPRWSDGTPAHSKFISQQESTYHIIDGQFPVQSMRPTAIKGAFYDIEAIYQKQTNIIEEMNPLIWDWWKDFVVKEYLTDGFCNYGSGFKYEEVIKYNPNVRKQSSIGQTYGHTVKRYDLMNKLLDGLVNNPFSRRHIINLWQEQQILEDPKALVPCAYETLYTVSQTYADSRMIDMTLNQRSQDYIMTASINPLQYVMFGQMICGHCEHETGIRHTLRTFKHNVQNVHIYDRHLFAIEELLNRKPQDGQFNIYLPVAKNFYDYKFEDFVIENPFSIEPLSRKLEIAV